MECPNKNLAPKIRFFAFCTWVSHNLLSARHFGKEDRKREYQERKQAHQTTSSLYIYICIYIYVIYKIEYMQEVGKWFDLVCGLEVRWTVWTTLLYSIVKSLIAGQSLSCEDSCSTCELLPRCAMQATSAWWSDVWSTQCMTSDLLMTDAWHDWAASRKSMRWDKSN